MNITSLSTVSTDYRLFMYVLIHSSQDPTATSLFLSHIYSALFPITTVGQLPQSGPSDSSSLSAALITFYFLVISPSTSLTDISNQSTIVSNPVPLFLPSVVIYLVTLVFSHLHIHSVNTTEYWQKKIFCLGLKGLRP